MSFNPIKQTSPAPGPIGQDEQPVREPSSPAIARLFDKLIEVLGLPNMQLWLSSWRWSRQIFRVFGQVVGRWARQ
jgi:hypothetical protein